MLRWCIILYCVVISITTTTTTKYAVSARPHSNNNKKNSKLTKISPKSKCHFTIFAPALHRIHLLGTIFPRIFSINFQMKI